ncbi:hypothetical protein [Legionella cardiaca]|uniref:Uncharacterized protein n=1 Tax=Legionella cardiaca TaxID=1071983 RepID=A0ABY8AWP0_9GAMM|nr:hypothetical protein [Legionella cardiaca]WED43572.1 hypothetical protein PXX05_02000 [Legionella cardiaca]
MTIHVFIGAGPANLHRALKIKKIDPTAQLIFIDKRLRPETQDIDRVKARANIFRFENEYVTKKLIKDGVKLEGLIHERDFSVSQGFQSGDDKVFSAKRFSQIQIRDLQLAFLKTLFASEGPKPLLIADDADVQHHQSVVTKVTSILNHHLDELDIDTSHSQDIQIHVATGAIKEPETELEKPTAEIIYPTKTQYWMPNATDDVKAMTVTPLHGTTTFVITDRLTCDQLKGNQRSLDLTPWQPALKEFGWTLVRPPRIRVFYANDILYIGAEIPVTMHNMKEKTEYEEAITEYTRTIAQLVFPDLDITSLPVNKHLRSRFPTDRGERGDVIATFDLQSESMNDLQESEHLVVDKIQIDQVTIFHHGDARYLPHYQTGSGFVTAFFQNELYAEIFSCKTFADLLTLAKKKDPAVYKDISAIKLKETYTKLANGDNKLALEAFQKELFMAFSRDIIEENKQKVGRYLNALHNQELEAFKNIDTLTEILNLCNKHLNVNLDIKQFKGIDPRVVVIQILKMDNINFLRAVLPQILNADLTLLSDRQVKNMRDMHILDYENNLNLSGQKLQNQVNTVRQILRHSLTTAVADKLNNKTGENLEANSLQFLSEILDNFKGDIVIQNMQNMIELKPEDIQNSLRDIVTSFELNTRLHQRAAISFFEGKHSKTIHQFVKDLRAIMTTHAQNPESMRLHALTTILEFNDTLQEGHSRRTLEALQNITKEVFPPPPPAMIA